MSRFSRTSGSRRRSSRGVGPTRTSSRGRSWSTRTRKIARSARWPAGSPDDLVSQQQHRVRDRQAECPRGLEIDDQLEALRLFDGKLRRLGPLEDLAHVDGSAPVHLRLVRSVGHQAADVHKLSPPEHRGKPVPDRKRDDLGSMDERESGGQHDERLGTARGGGGGGPLEALRAAPLKGLHPHAEGPRRVSRFPPCPAGAGIGRVRQDRQARGRGDRLLQQLEPLRAGVNFIEGQPRDVAARLREARDEPARHRIEHERDDGNRRGRLFRSEEHTSELQSLAYLVCRLLLEKKKQKAYTSRTTILREYTT